MRIRVRGRSMLPTLADGDHVDVSLAPATPRPGDVVLFLENGLPILHRVLSTKRGRLLTQGDASPRPDPPVPLTRVLGIAQLPPRPVLARRRALAAVVRGVIRRALRRP